DRRRPSQRRRAADAGDRAGPADAARLSPAGRAFHGALAALRFQYRRSRDAACPHQCRHPAGRTERTDGDLDQRSRLSHPAMTDRALRREQGTATASRRACRLSRKRGSLMTDYVFNYSSVVVDDLAAAARLYEQIGLVRVWEGQHPQFQTPAVLMAT